MKEYTIARWNEVYEDYRTRRVKVLSGVLLPNRFDAEGYGRIMAHPQAATIYTGWIHLVQIASRCDPRGKLVRSNGLPHTPETMSLKCKCPPEWFTLTLDFLERETDWLVVCEQKVDNEPVSRPALAPLAKDVAPASGQAPRLQHVIEWAKMIGLKDPEATELGTRFWNHYESTGWIDRNGNRITNARAKLASWMAADRQNAPNGQMQANTGASERILRSRELERLEEGLKQMRGTRPERPAYSDAEISEWRDRWNQMVRRKKELMQFLGFTC